MKIKPGIKVRLKSSEEEGVVVHTWVNEELDVVDCHVAFYGGELPIAEPKSLPYILRYTEASLEIID